MKIRNIQNVGYFILYIHISLIKIYLNLRSIKTNSRPPVNDQLAFTEHQKILVNATLAQFILCSILALIRKRKNSIPKEGNLPSGARAQ